MNNVYFGEHLYVKARIIRDDIDELVSSLQDKSKCVSFLFSLYSLLIQDPFLLLDKNLADKIYMFINLVAFRFSGDEEVRRSRDCVANKLMRSLKLDSFNNDEQVEDLLEKERIIRRIPDWFVMSREAVLKMYEMDFQNYSAVCNKEGATTSMELFYFLTTVHKMYNECPIFFKEDAWVAGFYSVIADFEQQEQDPLVLEYLEMTKDRLHGRDQDVERHSFLKNKIIPFPGQKIVNS